jgi:CBS domain-containing protein
LLKWLCRDEGTTSLEYALMIGIIVGAGLLAAQSLGDRLTSSYTVASAALASNNAVAADRPHLAAADYASWDDRWDRPIVARRLTSQLVPLAVALAAVALLVVQRRTARERHTESCSASSLPSPAEQPAYLTKRQEILRTMAADVRSLLHNRLLVRNVMSTTIHPIAPATSADEVKQLMSQRQVRHVLVCGPNHKLLGIISDRDLPVRSGATAADLMTRDAAVVAPDVAVAAAISVMLKRRISSLPVVEQNRVVGIITMTDVAMTLQCALQSLDKVATELEEQGFAPHPVARSLSTATSAVQHSL